mmetsp:Transcript_12368/g.18127  ORF Transcript_12368/g.18127 Transcript_12368/m.18127 type:complete len:670 (-) Transcript_12368:2085-4094(-)|eukprot:CAMPEP_0194241954 /NCGR_PEP_ID=MMETSP0158-20130606/7641_1 /TAXON_ID=33649 /ORGANISM="Thalassionema nitzschioides, Strain L26-B" /LENGTH=669 /DNA_ID=CAMNT_0038976945 /DNA_START=22 /DNA_END=2031 /DNA_ORIENTATION=-
MADDGDAGIPFYLMPVAAVVGTYALFGSFRVLYLIYANLTDKQGSAKPPPVALLSRTVVFLVITVLAALFAYAKIVAQVDYAMTKSEYSIFEPYDILGVGLSANATAIKQAYRSLSKEHHPDKGGDESTFHRIHTAYRALTTDKANYEQYGHPDGPITSKSLSFALPDWLLHPTGIVAIVLVLLYMGLFVGLIFYVISFTKKQNKDAAQKMQDMSVAAADTAYLSATLNPDSTHMEILLAIATTPESIQVSEEALDKIEMLRKEKLDKQKSEPKKKAANAFDLDDGDWDEDEDDPAAQKVKEEEALKQKAKEELAKAQGQGNIPMEGIDGGALGQKWVESVLEARGQWPPKALSFLEGKTFKYKNKVVSALEHPAIRRNLCFIIGRLNSAFLNTHHELLEAHSKNMIDPTYFQGSLRFRQRAGLLLEAALRFSVSLRSYRLAKTIIEAVCMFKVGAKDVSEETVASFKASMIKQYTEEGLPKLSISELKMETPDEDEIATGDLCAISMTADRDHAEPFTKVKVAICQKQGIPPQVALQTYREGWWVLVRAKKIDGGETPKAETPENPLSKMISNSDKQKFDKEKDENSLIVAWPMIVQNMAQKTGKVKVQFKAPTVPGKYEIYVAVKSQEFFGADQDLKLIVDIVDSEGLKREEDEGDNEEDTETKKEK